MNNEPIALAMIRIMTDPIHDREGDASFDLRTLLIDIDSELTPPASDYFSILRDCIAALSPHTLSIMRLDHSLCPLHAIDYAICFDDDDAECAAIRACFPHHDT